MTHKELVLLERKQPDFTDTDVLLQYIFPALLLHSFTFTNKMAELGRVPGRAPVGTVCRYEVREVPNKTLHPCYFCCNVTWKHVCSVNVNLTAEMISN